MRLTKFPDTNGFNRVKPTKTSWSLHVPRVTFLPGFRRAVLGLITHLAETSVAFSVACTYHVVSDCPVIPVRGIAQTALYQWRLLLIQAI